MLITTYEDGFFVVSNLDTGEELSICDSVEDADDFKDNFVGRIKRGDSVVKHTNGASGKVINVVGKGNVTVMWTFTKTPKIIAIKKLIKI